MSQHVRGRRQTRILRHRPPAVPTCRRRVTSLRARYRCLFYAYTPEIRCDAAALHRLRMLLRTRLITERGQMRRLFAK